MKRNMRGTGSSIRRSILFLLVLTLLISVLPTISLADSSTVGAYGSVTVTSKNVVIRATAAGTRTGYFAQKGTYAMIGPVVTVDGVEWYNIQTDSTAGYVSGDYAYASYGSAGMPSTEKTYVDVLSDITITKGDDPSDPDVDGTSGDPITVEIEAGTILQLVDGDSYSDEDPDGNTSTYINVYYYDTSTNTSSEYHTVYTTSFANGIMSEDNLNTHIVEVTWESSTTGYLRKPDAKGDYLTHALQAALYILGYYEDDVDGDYGDNTEDAVMEFRDDNGLDASNPNANALVFEYAFEQAADQLEYLRTTSGLSSTSSTSSSSSSSTGMIETNVDSLRIRKSYSTSSTYLGMIEDSGTILTYTNTHTTNSVTWYYIQYNGIYGWVMGTYVDEYDSDDDDDDSSSTITDYGTVTITKDLVAIRTSANGSRSGYHVNTGDVCTMIGPAVTAGGYTWYYIQTEGGRTGYVRGDCCEANFGSAGMPDTDKTYVQILYSTIEITLGSDPDTSSNTAIYAPQNEVLQFVTGSTYVADDDITYINLYYDNQVYFTKYTTALTDGIMTDDNTNNYISGTIWAQGFDSSMICGEEDTSGVTNYKGDIYVHAVQAALYQLGYMDDDDDMDGMFGDDTADAVKDFKDDYNVGDDSSEIVDDEVASTLFSLATAALTSKLASSSSSDDDDVESAGEFGDVESVVLGSWDEVDGGSTSLFPKGSVATVMSVDTKQVFRLYRWSGSNHADCVTYSTYDTSVLCSILGMTYDSSSPSSSELAKVISEGDEDWPDYTWPKMRWGGTTYANEDKIPVWINLDGTVYCASIYVIPHGYNGTSSFSLSTMNGSLFYEVNNMYGMLCVHFYGSTTHASGTVNSEHKANILYAYNQAASYFGSSLVD